jgi:uncharacterized protein (TIGR01777 family)
MMGADAPMLDESARPGDDPLARMCVDWERAAEPARSAGVRVVHPRIGVVLGAGGGVLARLVPAFRWGAGGPVGDGLQWVSWVHEIDVVRSLVHALDHLTLDGPFNVVAPEPVTMRELAAALGRALHRPSLLRVPAFTLRLALGEGLARMILTGQRVAPSALARSGFTFEYPTLGAALGQLAPRLR